MQKYNALLALFMIFLVGCSSAPKDTSYEPIPDDLPPVDETLSDPNLDPDAELGALNDGDADCLAPCIYPLDAVNDSSSDLAKRLIFFGYDDSSIQDEYNYTIEQHAIYLKSHPTVKIRLEGHTDERGSREYNVALGERRALSVRQVLLLQGVTSEQITTVSFGEELPLDLGRDESAWSQNRRVEIVYE